MSIAGGIMVPHPPLIIAEIGQGEEKKIRATIDAYHEAAKKLASWRPDTIVVLSPNSVMYADYFHISPGKGARGDFGRFRAPQVKFQVKYDMAFAEELEREAAEADIPAGTMGERDRRLDHGTMVPLYFLEQYLQDGLNGCSFVRIGLSGLPLSYHYRLGQCIRKTAHKLGRRLAVVGSGDLSHKLKPEGPYGFAMEGPEYDERIMDVMGRAAFGELLDFPEDFCLKAAECGHRSFVIMAGVFDRLSVKCRRLSHEGPFGVGYGICTYEVEGKDSTRNFLEQYEEKIKKEAKDQMEKEDPWVRLARQTIETYIRKGTKMEMPSDLPEELYTRRAGAFVSLKEEGKLRGCIGTIAPVRSCLAEEIMDNAVSAATKDPRFSPVKENELDRLVYSVDVLGGTERITSLKELDVKRYGVVVTRGRKRGLLLPDLEGVDTPEEQVAIAKRKAGIPEDEEDIILERFEVVRHR